MILNVLFVSESFCFWAFGFFSARLAFAKISLIIDDTAVMHAFLFFYQGIFARFIFLYFRVVLHCTPIVCRMIDKAHILAFAFLLSLFGCTLITRLTGMFSWNIFGLNIVISLYYAIFVGFLFLSARLPPGKSVAIVFFAFLAWALFAINDLANWGNAFKLHERFARLKVFISILNHEGHWAALALTLHNEAIVDRLASRV